MTSEEIKAEAREYANKIINLAVSMYNPAAETIAAQAYEDGIKKGLKQHEHDYLVKTADLKKNYEKQKEINKELVDDIAAARNEIGRAQKTALYNLDGWRKSDAELEKAKARIQELETQIKQMNEQEARDIRTRFPS